MRKHSFYFALLALSAFIAILAACGSGEIIDLNDRSSAAYEDWLKSNRSLEDLMNHCANVNPSHPACPVLSQNPGDSSPSGSSSSGDDSDPGASSSSSGLSSSSALLSSSSINPNAYPIPDYTCAWDPSTVVSGDNSKITVDISGWTAVDKDVGECNIVEARTADGLERSLSGTWVKVFVGNNVIDGMYATFPYDEIIQTSGEVTESERIHGFSGVGKFVWPGNGNFSVSVVAECGSGISRNRSYVACANLSIVEAPAPTPTAGTSISFTGGRDIDGEHIFFIGETPVANNTVTIGNNDANPSPGCETTTTTVRIEGNTDAPVSSTRLIYAHAVATCRGVEKIVATTTAVVVPNPSLSGD
ncbi:MAG: hypothetical protein FWH22_02860 [Fibromonadales bacterium]|nr:hypothetical protein [Fibromonadales bacterium]